MIKQLIKSKTILFACLLSALGVVQASTEVFAQFMTPTAYGVFTLVVGVAVAILRTVTTTSLGEK